MRNPSITATSSLQPGDVVMLFKKQERATCEINLTATERDELVAGQRYNLYVLYDVVLPVARCVFEMPEAEKSGCSTAGSLAGGSAWLIVAGGLLMWRRREREASAAEG